MERDFMGLTVKREDSEEAIDAAPLRSSKMQWPVSNKSSSVPQLLSFQTAHSEKPKTGFDSLASSGLVTITTTETFNSGAMQINNFPENQGGVRYTVTSYPTNHLDAHATHRPVTTHTNLTIPSALGPTVHQSFISPSGQNLISPISPQPISAVPMPNPVPTMPSNSPVVGTTDLRNTPKISGAPAQLTIFYNGSVCVYDNVSPEKAQAMMLLAGGNGPSSTSNTTVPAASVQASVPRPSILESFVVNHPYTTTPRRSSPTSVPRRSSPTPVPSNSTVPQPLGWSGTINSTAAPKHGGILVSSNKVEPQKVPSSPASVSETFLPSSTVNGSVPQFRRKSLARFLEKRKERVISGLPYLNKEPPNRNSSGSCPVSAIN